ncbi:MAG: branched-chain amino acid ABC transporter permease [Alphaproteobacteria bacterium]
MMVNRPVMALIACLVVAGVTPFVADTYFLGVALDLLMWVALAESWVLLSGMTGYISLGHAVFFGAGSYVMVLCWGLLPFWLVVPLAGLVAGLLALGVGYPCLRVRGPYFVILSFGVAEFVKFVVVSIEAGLGRAGRLLFGTPSLETLYFVMLALATAAVVMVYQVRRSRFGAGLRAIREDEDAAETIGVPTTRFKLLAYGLSAIIPGMVGAVMVLRSTYFEPLHVFNPVVSFTIVSMAIIGGSDDAPGPFMGAVSLVILSEILWANLPELYMILLGVLLVGFVLGAPNGIYGWLRARRVGTGT